MEEQMTTMTVKSHARTASAMARLQALETNPVVQDVLAWATFAGLSAIGFLVFILAIWI
jgi:hypothetical protein